MVEILVEVEILVDEFDDSDSGTDDALTSKSEEAFADDEADDEADDGADDEAEDEADGESNKEEFVKPADGQSIDHAVTESDSDSVVASSVLGEQDSPSRSVPAYMWGQYHHNVERSSDNEVIPETEYVQRYCDVHRSRY